MPASTTIWGVGDAYEPYVGRWSRLVAREFLAWLAVPNGRGWLDVGCGTGALSQTILTACAPGTVTGLDSSSGFIDYARAQVDDARVSFVVGDAQAFPDDIDACDAAVSGLMLNFVPSPIAAVMEMTRVTRPGGSVAAYVWDYAGEMQLMRQFWDAAAELIPASRDLDEGSRFTLCQPDRLADLFQQARLEDVDVHPIDIATVFMDFDDYWTPFLGGQGSAPGYVMSLSKAERVALRERLRESLPTRSDGSIHLIARAWAVKGTRSSTAE